MSSSWGKTEKKRKEKAGLTKKLNGKGKKKERKAEKSKAKKKNLSKGSFVSLSSGRALCAVRAVISQLFS